MDLVHHEEQQPHYNFDDDEFVSNENDSSEYVNYINDDDLNEGEDDEEVSFLTKLIDESPSSFLSTALEIASKKLRAPVYHGDSKRTQERRRSDLKELQEAARIIKI